MDNNTSPIIDLGDLAARSGAAKPAWKSQTDDLNLNLVVLEAGHGVAEHTNTEVDVLLIGIEGVGHVAIEGETHLLRTGQMTVIRKGAARSIHCKAGRFAYFTCHRRRAGLWPEGIPRGNAGLR